MEIKIMPRGNLQIDNAKIIFRNFKGEKGPYNRDGERRFSLIIDDSKWANMLIEEGWNVKIRPPKEEGEEAFMHLPIKIKFNNRGPSIYLRSGTAMNKLSEDTCECIDTCDIISVDLDIRPYDWEVNGETGRTAYLDSMCVVQNVDRFATMYEKDTE